MTKWDIYSAEVKFEEKNESKKRPVIVIIANSEKILVFKCTTKSRPNEIEYKLVNWIQEGLTEETTVRLTKKIQIKNDQILNYLGKLTKTDIDGIKKLCKENNISLTEDLTEEMKIAFDRVYTFAVDRFDTDGNLDFKDTIDVACIGPEDGEAILEKMFGKGTFKITDIIRFDNIVNYLLNNDKNCIINLSDVQKHYYGVDESLNEITLESNLKLEELNKVCDDYSDDRLSLNLAYLTTHNIDGSRKDVSKQLEEEKEPKTGELMIWTKGDAPEYHAEWINVPSDISVDDFEILLLNNGYEIHDTDEDPEEYYWFDSENEHPEHMFAIELSSAARWWQFNSLEDCLDWFKKGNRNDFNNCCIEGSLNEDCLNEERIPLNDPVKQNLKPEFKARFINNADYSKFRVEDDYEQSIENTMEALAIEPDKLANRFDMAKAFDCTPGDVYKYLKDNYSGEIVYVELASKTGNFRLKESLNESQSQEIGNTYKYLSKKYNINLDELVYGEDGFMKTCYPEGFPDFKGDVIYSEKYWNEFENWLKDNKGIELIGEEEYNKYLDEKIEKQTNVEYKGFTIEHFPVTWHFGDKEEDVDGWIIHAPGYFVGNDKQFPLPLRCHRSEEDDRDTSINFKTVEEAEAWIDEFGDNYKVTIEHGDEIHAWPKTVDEELVNEENLEETYSDDELDKMVGKVYNIRKLDKWYRNDGGLFAHTICTNCGREKDVFLSNLINDPEKYGSCICSDTNIDGKIDYAQELYTGGRKLSSNTSGYTGVSFVKTYKGQPYNKWRAYIEVDGKRTYLGDFDKKKDAIKARKTAAEKGVKWYKNNRNKITRDMRRKTKKYANSKYRDNRRKTINLKDAD